MIQIAVALALVLALPVGAPAQDQTPGSARAAVDQLRALHFQQDYDGGRAAGMEAVRRFPDDPEVRAWYAAHLARRGRSKEVLLLADSMTQRWPESPWTQFARAYAASHEEGREEEAIAAARKALQAAPSDRYAAWINGYVLNRQRKYVEAETLMDSLVERTGPWAELVVLQAEATNAQQYTRTADGKLDAAKFDQALELFSRAREMDPDNVNAHTGAGSILRRARRIEEAHALLRRAAELSPHSTGVQSGYWWSVLGLPGLTLEQKQEEVLRSVRRLLAVRGDAPQALLDATQIYRELKLTDELREVEGKILREHPKSGQAEWVLVNGNRAMARAIRDKSVADTAAARAQYRQMLWNFIERPNPVREGLTGEAYLNLFHQYGSDPDASPDTLLRVVQGMAKYERLNPHFTYVEAPMRLAERTPHYREAEQIVRDGFEFIKDHLAERKSMYATVGEYADALDYQKASLHDALGWIYFNEGRLEDAERELKRAVELKKDFPLTYYHLGRMAESKGDLDEAEVMYGRGRGFEIRGRKRNHEALEALFVKRHGSAEGFEAYAAQLDERDRARRRQKIAESRIANPKPAPAFALERMEGGSFSSEELKGKIAVINFWGVWCGPCVHEAPQIQKFHDQFKDDPDIVFLTIDNDPNPDDVRKWMAEKKFDFPVLLDRGFVQQAGIGAFPTTWFLDRDGRIAFEHRGASDVVLEEFVWRVEMLKEEPSKAAAAR
jgi:Flp pilus assembly protein TadD/thiol-disulfide isomerase/thioredoxin